MKILSHFLIQSLYHLVLTYVPDQITFYRKEKAATKRHFLYQGTHLLRQKDSAELFISPVPLSEVRSRQWKLSFKLPIGFHTLKRESILWVGVSDHYHYARPLYEINSWYPFNIYVNAQGPSNTQLTLGEKLPCVTMSDSFLFTLEFMYKDKDDDRAIYIRRTLDEPWFMIPIYKTDTIYPSFRIEHFSFSPTKQSNIKFVFSESGI